MFWELRSVVDGIKGEYQGWHRFKRATGLWPACSILTGVFSIPVWFAAGAYGFIAALETSRLSLIYTALLAGVIGGAVAWYGLRRLACKLDVARARMSSGAAVSTKDLEGLLR
jgi:hypothetical protein